MQASNDFNNRLTHKNHSGRLIFDHHGEALSLEVSPEPEP